MVAMFTVQISPALMNYSLWMQLTNNVSLKTFMFDGGWANENSPKV